MDDFIKNETLVSHDKKTLMKLWRNYESREVFFKAYRDWGVWFSVPEVDFTFFRYQLPNGDTIIAMEHNRHTYVGIKEGYQWSTGVRYYIKKSGKLFTPDNLTSSSALNEILKNVKTALQKEKE
jgi:hypothetical protein